MTCVYFGVSCENIINSTDRTVYVRSLKTKTLAYTHTRQSLAGRERKKKENISVNHNDLCKEETKIMCLVTWTSLTEASFTLFITLCWCVIHQVKVARHANQPNILLAHWCLQLGRVKCVSFSVCVWVFVCVHVYLHLKWSVIVLQVSSQWAKQYACITMMVYNIFCLFFLSLSPSRVKWFLWTVVERSRRY